MAILYKKVVRSSDPTQANSAKKAYPVIIYRYSHAANLAEFSKEISNNSYLSERDVSSVLNNFCRLLKKTLICGRLVNIDGLGCFSLSLQSQGIENPEKLTAADISGLRICFRANKDIRLKVGNAATCSDELVFIDIDRINNKFRSDTSSKQ